MLVYRPVRAGAGTRLFPSFPSCQRSNGWACRLLAIAKKSINHELECMGVNGVVNWRQNLPRITLGRGTNDSDSR